MVRLDRSMFGLMMCTNAIEQVACKPCCRPIAMAWWVTELNAVVRQDSVQSVWEGVDQVAQELAGDHAGGLGLQPGEDELGCPVDANEQMEFALLGPDLCDVDMNVADRLGLERRS